MSEVADCLSALCPVCGESAKWEKGQRGGLLVSCAPCDLDHADADEVERRLGAPKFEAVDEGRYRLEVPGVVVFEVDFLRREGRQLKGELLVRCELPGARTYDGTLSTTDFNFSSTRVRSGHAKYLAERAQAKDLDWVGWLEEFCQRVVAAERQGQPAVWLDEMPEPEPDQFLPVDGIELLRHQTQIFFGDGATGKSLIGLHILGTLEQQHNLRVGLFDWELTEDEHCRRLRRLFGSALPRIRYARCAKPFVHEVDRLRRIVRDDKLDFVMLDSIGFATDGPAEAQESASRYFQALRQLGPIGSLNVAHITKSFEGADKKPFGSVFWHNGARATWNIKTADADPNDDTLTVGLYNRKQNLGARQPSVGYKFRFEGRYGPISVRRVDLGDVADLAKNLTTRERIRFALRSGPRTRTQLKAAMKEVKDPTFRWALNDAIKKGQLLKFPSGKDGDDRFALPERRSEP